MSIACLENITLKFSWNFRALLSMDSKEELPMDMVEQLLKFVPTNEERALLDERSQELDSLSRADRFLYDVSK
jgi:dishevelled associated activator of morphogenesis